MRGIAGKAAQGAAAAVVSSITPAAAAKSGAFTRYLLQCHFSLLAFMRELMLPLSGADAVRELLQLSGSSDWECARPLRFNIFEFSAHTFLFRYYQDSDDVAVFTMPPREGIPYRSVMGRGSITCAGGLATFLPLINGVSNINKWDHKFQQVQCPPSLSFA